MKKIIPAVLLSLLVVNISVSREPTTVLAPEIFKPVIIDQIIIDPLFEEKLERPRPSLLPPKIIIKEIKVPRAQIKGVASWYCKTGVSRCTVGYSGGYYAAIRRDLLELRGSYVLVCAEKCVRVKIIDCNCGPNANLIDLYWDAFTAISNPKLGRIKVTISW